MAVLFRSCKGPQDAESFAQVHRERREADGVLEGFIFEAFPSASDLARELDGADPLDWVVAEADGKVVGYGHAMVDWPEMDHRHCYLHLGWVSPDHRGKGIGTGLIERLEARCREKAVRDGAVGRSDFGANASSSELSASQLLLDAGYEVLYTVLAMERPTNLSQPTSPMPGGYELRPVVPENHGAIWQMIGDAYFDPNESSRGKQVGSDHDFATYFERDADASLWFVAWQSSRVAGAVLCRIRNQVATVYEVSVGHAHRRHGLARALLTRALQELESRHPKAIRIVTKKEFPTQAWRLYESVGFNRIKDFPRWRKFL
jgi:ribosomal protein S18 acetylase RimI-like enzyme